jgi:sulfatase maturation enzyme AslB (radical SAM superfamily)
MAASSLIFVDKSSSHGRGLFCSRDVDVGECLYTAAPVFMGVLSWERLPDTCSNCFRREGEEIFNSKLQVKACSQCKLLRFCSKVCSFHEVVLGFLQINTNKFLCGDRAAKLKPGRSFTSLNVRILPIFLIVAIRRRSYILLCEH